jgi:hypothetical protein
VDGSFVHPNTSASPYAHWDWMYYSTRNFSSQCGVARYNTSFDYFLGGLLWSEIRPSLLACLVVSQRPPRATFMLWRMPACR